MDEYKADNSKDEIKAFVNEQNNPKPNERKKRKHISTWIGAFKVRDKATQVSANFNSDIGLISKATNLPYAEVN